MPANNLIGRTLEQFGEGAKKAVKKEAHEVADAFASQIDWTFGVKTKPSEQEKQEVETNKMYEVDGYKQALRELDKLKGAQTDEDQLDKKVSRDVQEKYKKIIESWSRHKQELKADAQASPPPQDRGEQKTEDKPLKASHERTNPEQLGNTEPILPGSKGKKFGRQKMQTRILNRSKTKTETGRNQGIG